MCYCCTSRRAGGHSFDAPLCCWSAGPSERVSMSISGVVLQFLGSECALRCVVYAKWVVPLHYRVWVFRRAQVFIGDVTYSSCTAVVCV